MYELFVTRLVCICIEQVYWVFMTSFWKIKKRWNTYLIYIVYIMSDVKIVTVHQCFFYNSSVWLWFFYNNFMNANVLLIIMKCNVIHLSNNNNCYNLLKKKNPANFKDIPDWLLLFLILIALNMIDCINHFFENSNLTFVSAPILQNNARWK